MDDEYQIDQLGPCATHATLNCLECFDIEPEDLDEDGDLIVVNGAGDNRRAERWKSMTDHTYLTPEERTTLKTSGNPVIGRLLDDLEQRERELAEANRLLVKRYDRIRELERPTPPVESVDSAGRDERTCKHRNPILRWDWNLCADCGGEIPALTASIPGDKAEDRELQKFTACFIESIRTYEDYCKQVCSLCAQGYSRKEHDRGGFYHETRLNADDCEALSYEKWAAAQISSQAETIARLEKEKAHEMFAHNDTIRERDEQADTIRRLERFEKAFNLMLSAVNPTVRGLAQRYLEGVESYEQFVAFLRSKEALAQPSSKPGERGKDGQSS